MCSLNVQHRQHGPVAWVIFYVMLKLEGLAWPTHSTIKTPLTEKQCAEFESLWEAGPGGAALDVPLEGAPLEAPLEAFIRQL